jgi:hypothetical protein
MLSRVQPSSKGHGPRRGRSTGRRGGGLPDRSEDAIAPRALGRGSALLWPAGRDPRADGHRRRAQRKPRLLFRFDGAFLLRFAARTLEGLSLFQLPPRLTRAACPGAAESTPDESYAAIARRRSPWTRAAATTHASTRRVVTSSGHCAAKPAMKDRESKRRYRWTESETRLEWSLMVARAPQMILWRSRRPKAVVIQRETQTCKGRVGGNVMR